MVFHFFYLFTIQFANDGLFRTFPFTICACYTSMCIYSYLVFFLSICLAHSTLIVHSAHLSSAQSNVNGAVDHLLDPKRLFNIVELSAELRVVVVAWFRATQCAELEYRRLARTAPPEWSARLYGALPMCTRREERKRGTNVPLFTDAASELKRKWKIIKYDAPEEHAELPKKEKKPEKKKKKGEKLRKTERQRKGV